MQVQQDEEWDDWVRQAFKSLDSNQDGVICEEDMRMTSVDLDEVCTAVHASFILCYDQRQACLCSIPFSGLAGVMATWSFLFLLFEHPCCLLCSPSEGGSVAACCYATNLLWCCLLMVQLHILSTVKWQ